MDDFVSKPVNARSLAAILERWVGGSGLDAGEPADETTQGPSLVLDPSHLESFLGLGPGGTELLERTVTSFLASSRNDLVLISEAVAAGSAEEVVHAAHSLKGGALMLGATRLAAVCDELEVLGAARDLGPAPVVLARLSVELELASSALRVVQADQRACLEPE
jgi:HPt (histidine-containing phosphotransfer) domain-containing protein